MRLRVGQLPAVAAVTVAIELALFGVARAQDQLPAVTSSAGIVTGEVDRCLNGAESPAPQVAIGVDGGSQNLTRSDVNGQFTLALAPGQYTIVALADDGSSANRPYVPVEAGTSLDIGILDLGGGLSGCGSDADMTEPVLPTFTPSPTEVPPPATPTPAPTSPPPTTTPVPAEPAEPTPSGD